jgi:glycosyltransferase involved in cell wall biosynthesis
MKVLLIVPAYNEAANIEKVVRTIQSAGYDYVVVNDGSKDDTLDILQRNGFNYLNLSKNLGIGGAVQAGHRYALEHGYDVDIQFDGDGQHDVGYVDTLLKGIEEGSNLVIGSRFVKETEGFQSTFMRRVGIKWLEKMIHLFTGMTVTDATSGFRACDRRTIELFCHYYPSDYPEPESIVYACKSGMKVSEVPVIMHERQGGVSSIGALSGAYYMVKVSLAIAMVGFARHGRSK